jgi:predicted DCC family thiol-disulfide oxidoreductase YuxK
MQAIILFDGICNLCNGTVQFILPRDKAERFGFASLQSPKGQEILNTHHLLDTNLDSIVLVENGKIYTHSSAALRIFTQLGWAWKWAYLGYLCPRFLRDAIYRWVAKNRYRWFGKSESCWLPRPEWKGRFL